MTNPAGLLFNKCRIIKPEGFTIPQAAERVHGISHGKRLYPKGLIWMMCWLEFEQDLHGVQLVIGHNVSFDLSILGAEYIRRNIPSRLQAVFCGYAPRKNPQVFCSLLPGGKEENSSGHRFLNFAQQIVRRRPR
ncbi:MAG: hypothetical protein MZV63_31305 [Marinilabiliales bacterium]|nr:hypothetical protein [Marinilabiliales bacterium]